MSADPLAVHVPGEADLNVYAYVHGKMLRAVDPFGLCEIGAGGACSNPVGGSQGTSGQTAYGQAPQANQLGFDPNSPNAARAAGAAMGSISAGLPIAGEAMLAAAMHDLRGKLDRNTYNAWLPSDSGGRAERQ